jgi:hypothetical protein
VRLILAWVGLVPLMIANGVARVSLYGPLMSELSAHQVSSATGVALLVTYTWLVFPWLRLDSARAAWGAGGLWLVMTVAFEFLFGHFVAGNSWARLLQDYDLSEGRVWLLVLVAIVVVPRLIFQVRHERPATSPPPLTTGSTPWYRKSKRWSRPSSRGR